MGVGPLVVLRASGQNCNTTSRTVGLLPGNRSGVSDGAANTLGCLPSEQDQYTGDDAKHGQAHGDC